MFNLSHSLGMKSSSLMSIHSMYRTVLAPSSFFGSPWCLYKKMKNEEDVPISMQTHK